MPSVSRITFVLHLVLAIVSLRQQATGLSFPVRRRTLFETSGAFLYLLAPPAQAVQLPSDSEIQSTITGVQYRDDRIGNGPVVSKDEVLVMHIQGLTRDGSVFLDTREKGKPLLHKLGTVQDFDFFGGDSSKRLAVTLGVEDGLRGMKLGGVRRLVVPSPLGYGHAGVSRYDAMRMGLLKPIPRDEMLRYEVELLRCVDLPATNNGLVSQACCTEPNYPCKTSDPDTGDS